MRLMFADVTPEATDGVQVMVGKRKKMKLGRIFGFQCVASVRATSIHFTKDVRYSILDFGRYWHLPEHSITQI